MRSVAFPTIPRLSQTSPPENACKGQTPGPEGIYLGSSNRNRRNLPGKIEANTNEIHERPCDPVARIPITANPRKKQTRGERNMSSYNVPDLLIRIMFLVNGDPSQN